MIVRCGTAPGHEQGQSVAQSVVCGVRGRMRVGGWGGAHQPAKPEGMLPPACPLPHPLMDHGNFSVASNCEIAPKARALRGSGRGSVSRHGEAPHRD